MMLHLLVVVMILFSKDENIRAALPQSYSQSQFEDAESVFDGVLALTMVCFAIEAVGIFGGFTTFNNGLAFLQICAHFSATAALSYFVVDRWHHMRYWSIWLFTSAIPALFETIAISRVLCCRARRW